MTPAMASAEGARRGRGASRLGRRRRTTGAGALGLLLGLLAGCQGGERSASGGAASAASAPAPATPGSATPGRERAGPTPVASLAVGSDASPAVGSGASPAVGSGVSPAVGSGVAPGVASGASPPPGEDVTRLFDGPPGRGVKFGKHLALRWKEVQVSAPAGWKGWDEYYDGLITLTAPDGSAAMALQGGTTPTTPQLDLWARSIGARGITWQEPVEGRQGPEHRPARIGRGRGLLNRAPARFWWVEVDVGVPPTRAPSGSPARWIQERVLVLAALADGAAAERRAELLACVRSIHRVG